MKVFVASAWWRECDPFVSVVALDAKQCEEVIDKAIEEEAERAEGDDLEDVVLGRGDIAWSGVFEEELEGLKLEEAQEEDLIEDGYVYL